MSERFSLTDQIAQLRAIDEFTERTTPEQARSVWRALVRGSERYYEGLWRARRLANGERE